MFSIDLFCTSSVRINTVRRQGRPLAKALHWRLVSALMVGSSVMGGAAVQAATLFSQPAYQSPVRAEPDDLLLLPGEGFAAGDVVVYQALTDTTQALKAPPAVPTTSDVRAGLVPVISAASIPHSLTVRLPATLPAGQSYALWVVSAKQQWSNGIKINDARPLWFSPAYVYETAAIGALPRYLKVVGRNLQPAPGKLTQVRLVNAELGKPSFTLNANNDNDPATAIEHYAAQADLPASLPRGTYTVQVSRDGVSWVGVEGQSLTVRPDPSPPAEFPVTRYGCLPNDGKDDTSCVREAIKHASQSATGGTVLFAAGTWNLLDNSANDYRTGLLVPVNVDLRGAGAKLTKVVRGAAWNDAAQKSASPSFTLLGNNTVQGITFGDAKSYQPGEARTSPMFRLGKIWYTVATTESKTVRDVVIANNVFDKPDIAIASGGLSIERLFVTGNEFGAYAEAINLGGDANNPDPYHIDDAVINANTFKPGSYMDVPMRQGVIATEIGASRRMDFSNNSADGSSSQYLSQPATDAKGWRAAFFWHMSNNHEMLLVSQNSASCTGDKTGDGEAIAFDNNQNTFGFSAAQTVLKVTANSVTVRGPLQATQGGKGVPTAYYNEHWVQIAQGTGVGQVRRIVSYVTSANAVTLNVDPAWDVIPQTDSRLALGREFWQVYMVDNLVDHREPLCKKSNRKNSPDDTETGGVIGLWAQATDSAIEGNRQYDSGGIMLRPAYSATDADCPTCTAWTFLQSFVEVRGNLIDHEYNWGSTCSWSGIMASYAASPTPGSPPPISGYGLSFAWNTIVQADGLKGGAISLNPSWWDGPPPGKWDLIDNILVHHNTIRDLKLPTPRSDCKDQVSERIGISLNDSVWRAVLYANQCASVTKPLKNSGAGTVRECTTGLTNSCECGTAKLRVN